MRVLYFGSCSRDEGDAANLMLRSLMHMSGVELFRFDAGLHGKTPSEFTHRRGRVNQISDDVIDRLARKTKPDAVICADGLTLSSAMHEELSDRGIRRVGITFSDQDDFKARARYSAAFDLFYTGSPSSIPGYAAVGVQARYLPIAVDPLFYRPFRLRKKSDVLAIGNAGPERVRLIGSLRSSGLKVRCLGEGWGRGILRLPKPGSSWTERVREISSATLVLSFSGVMARIGVFEAASCGACVLAEDSAELLDLLSPGTDLFTYRSEEEAVSEAVRLCRHPETAQRTGISARSRILLEHTWERRWQVVLEDMRQLLPPECPAYQTVT